MVAMMANGPIVTSDAERASPPEGPKHSKMSPIDKLDAHAAVELKYFGVILIFE